mmetsp:Transcript_14198/g.20977  ORF Transcript_14198/g.20977 Transcript_14198/m.20977 type:complete len:499 (-) Transcript_14198:95-1591(-)|eukprot:CAMPEP_0194200406 /NCGR_PEP_ID=MMETSP0156-20130528/1021_1 /TAXON_ID=33649 /ORGANISM="Thalassionema nitzschioides, Strain L26-B" /LENGTH=498 /DNA_ID=CAMNT_0038925393 /DNA_START=67 /DNA_END=1563 /DNA_ORIENTATION=-
MFLGKLLAVLLLPTLTAGQCNQLDANLDVELNLFGFAKTAVFGIYDWSLLTSDNDVKVTFTDNDNWSTYRRNFCLPRNKLHEVYVDSTSTDKKPDGQATTKINGHTMFDNQLINDRFQSVLIYPDRKQCGDGWTKVKLVMKFGDNPENIDWVLKENSTPIFSSASTYEASRREYSDIFYRNILIAEKCVGGGSYEFEITSSNSQGLGTGELELYTNDSKIATISKNFGRSSKKTFSLDVAPPIEGSLGICFSGESMVKVKDKGAVPIADLVLGDVVQVGRLKYEPIYSFGHKNGNSSAEYLRIATEGSRTPLEISPNHMVVMEGGRHVPASLVKKGDRLMSSQDELVVVTKITTVIRQGVFAPFTPSGTIVVNSIVASNYIAYQGSEYLQVGGFQTRFTYQWIAHTFNSVHRLAVQMGQIGETYTPQGVSRWVDGPHRLMMWALQQHVLVSTTLIGLALVVVSLTRWIELILVSPVWSVVAIVSLVVLMYRRRSTKKV